MTEPTPKPARRRRRADDDARLARALVLALDCLEEIYADIERTGGDMEEQVARWRREKIKEAITSVRSVNAGHAVPEGDA